MVLGTRRLRGRRPGRGAARLVGVDLGHLFSSVVCSRGLPFDLRWHSEDRRLADLANFLAAPNADSDGVARGKLDGEPSRSLWCPAGCSQFGFGCDFEAKLLSVFLAIIC